MRRVRRIVFIDAGIYVEPSAAEGIMRLPLGIGRAVARYAFGGGPWSINALVCRHLVCRHLGRRWPELARVAGTTDTLRAMMRAHRSHPDGAALIAAIPKITTPALVVWGEKDNSVPLAHGERLARETGARLEIVRDAVHMPHLREPERVGRMVREFPRPAAGS